MNDPSIKPADAMRSDAKTPVVLEQKPERVSPMPSAIVVMLTAMVSGMVAALYHYEIPTSNRDFATFMFGQVFTLWAASVMYWVGTTRSSAEKDRRKP